MKIDLEHAPQIRNLIDTLLSDISVRQDIEKIEPTQLRVTSPEVSASFTIGKDELLAVFQARIEAGMKTINSRYQLDFSKTNATVAAPALPRVEGEPA